MLPVDDSLLEEPERVAGTQAGHLTNSIPYGVPCGRKELDLSSVASNNRRREQGKMMQFQLTPSYSFTSEFPSYSEVIYNLIK